MLENDLIRDRLVLGTKDSSARARMLREPKLDLQKAIDMCRSSEISKSQLKDMSNEQETVNFSRSNSQGHISEIDARKDSWGESQSKERNRNYRM